MKNPVKESDFSSLPLEEQTIMRKTYKRMGPAGEKLLKEMLGRRGQRGGSWQDYIEFDGMYLEDRSGDEINYGDHVSGFRIVRTKKNEKSSK